MKLDLLTLDYKKLMGVNVDGAVNVTRGLAAHEQARWRIDRQPVIDRRVGYRKLCLLRSRGCARLCATRVVRCLNFGVGRVVDKLPT